VGGGNRWNAWDFFFGGEQVVSQAVREEVVERGTRACRQSGGEEENSLQTLRASMI